MSGKNLAQLYTTNSAVEGDLFHVRKTQQGYDKAISYSNLVNSLGNSGVQGFTAINDSTNNEIILNTVNGVIIPNYYQGMKVSFINPAATNDTVTVKIGFLNYVNLYMYKTTNTVVLGLQDYVEAVYIGTLTNGNFYQISNSLANSYTNDYKVVNLVTNLTIQRTDITIVSASGLPKVQIYEGMTIIFNCPQDTVGFVYITVDGLEAEAVQSETNFDNPIPSPLYAGQTVLAIYDGSNFIVNYLAKTALKPIVGNEPEPVAPVFIAPNVDIFDPNYFDVNDYRNAKSPTDVDGNGNLFFVSTITVGSGGNFSNVRDAINSLVQKYGPKGGGKKYAISILNSYNSNYLSIGADASTDVSWISIFSQNNKVISFVGNSQGSTGIVISTPNSPILNFPMQISGQISVDSNIYCLIRFFSSDANTLNFGINASLSFNMTGNIPSYFSLIRGPDLSGGNTLTIIAQNGLVVSSPYPLFTATSYNVLLNKAKFTHTGTSGFIINANQTNQDSNIKIYNSTFSFSNQVNTNILGAFNFNFTTKIPDIYMRNVTNTNRSGAMIGIQTINSNTILENCNFQGTNTVNDICVAGTSSTNLIQLIGTTGSTNQPIGTRTNRGLIEVISRNN